MGSLAATSVLSPENKGKRGYASLSPEAFDIERRKRCRTGVFSSENLDENSPVISQRQMSFFEHRKQAEISKLRTEFEQCMMKKNQEIEMLSRDLYHRKQSETSYKQEMEKLNAENRLLKRAITIQNQKKEEAVHEASALKNLLQQAVDHIKRTEQANYALRVHLQTNENVSADSRPPDVF